MKKDLKVAVIQYTVPISTKEGEKKVEDYVKKSSEGADLVGLPEDCLAKFEDVKSGYDPLNFLSGIAKNTMYIYLVLL